MERTLDSLYCPLWVYVSIDKQGNSASRDGFSFFMEPDRPDQTLPRVACAIKPVCCASSNIEFDGRRHLSNLLSYSPLIYDRGRSAFSTAPSTPDRSMSIITIQLSIRIDPVPDKYSPSKSITHRNATLVFCKCNQMPLKDQTPKHLRSKITRLGNPIFAFAH